MLIRFLLLFLSPVCLGQIPAYYTGVDFSLSGDYLKLQLTQRITETHTTVLPYTASGTADVWDAIKMTDLDPANSQNVLLIYGWNDTDASITNDRSRNKNLSCHTSSCTGLWNREHVYPRSLGTPNLGFEFAGSDAHNLRAADTQWNSTRSNRKFEDGAGAMSYVTSLGNWYPGDEWRGDIARMMMYMYVRYPTQCLPTAVGVGTSNYSNYNEMPDIFLEWNQEDPVSNYELQRNEVLESLQGNRNPFIDNPYIATMIWNGPGAEDRWGLLTVKESAAEKLVVYPTITDDFVYFTSTANDTNCTVYNLMGQVVVPIVDGNRIDMTALAKGIYLVQVGNMVEKVVRR